MLTGTYTALATPFRDDAFDEGAFQTLIDSQLEAGVDGIVPVGTTGESPTLDHAEHMLVIEKAVEFASGRCRVIAGTGSNSTREAVALTRDAEAAGVDAALLVAPYYNKPSQDGLLRHFLAVAGATSLPLVLYSIPGRCGVEIAVDTVARLAAECPRIRCLKEAGGTPERVSMLRRALPDDFTILSGDDSLTLPFLSVGASGVISVASNVIPAQVAAMVAAHAAGRADEARELHLRYYQLFRDLFIETNPVPVKFALAETGVTRPDVRLPLCQLAPPHAERLRSTLARLDLI